MANEEVVSYIQARLRQDANKEGIMKELSAAGWTEEEVSDAFASVETPSPEALSEVPPAPGIGDTQNSELVEESVGIDDLGGLVSKSFNVYFSRFGTFLGIVFLPMLVMFAAIMGTTGVAYASMMYADPLVLIPVFIIVVIAGIFIQVLGQVALIVSVHQKTGVLESYKQALPMVFSYIWITILVGLVVMGGILLLIVPGIVFGVWFSMAIYVFVVEGKHGTRALTQSKEYVKGHGWAVFGYFFLFGLILMGITIMTLIPVGILTVFLPSELSWISEFVQQFVSVALQPLGAIFGYLLFMGLRAAKTQSGQSSEGEKSTGKTIGLVALGIVGTLVLIGGILGSVVLASLNTARTKGNDAAIKSNLSGMRAMAELYYDDGGYGDDARGYAGYCEYSSAKDAIAAAQQAGGTAMCNDSKEEWAAWAALASDDSGYFCVDSTGVANTFDAYEIEPFSTSCPEGSYDYYR